jgi:hypothetical protein
VVEWGLVLKPRVVATLPLSCHERRQRFVESSKNESEGEEVPAGGELFDALEKGVELCDD